VRERACKNCGGKQYKVVGQNMVKCLFCGTLYVDEHASKEEEVLLVGAHELLRELQFSDAVEEFDKILSLFPMSFGGYYGRALAKNKIVLYNNKRGTSKTARFFGKEIPNISEDLDFQKAIELAPSDVAKNYRDLAKKIDKDRQKLETASSECEVFLFSLNTEDPAVDKVLEQFKKKELKMFCQKGALGKEGEAEIYKALQSCKTMVFFANEQDGYFDGDVKNIFDRYRYFISEKLKGRNSLIVVHDSTKIQKKQLPKELTSCKNFIEMNEISFLQDVVYKAEEEIKNSISETTKIEKRILDKATPKRKEYVEIESVTPSELGNFEIENLQASEINKIKWIFIALKHGDFKTAQGLINKELENDNNNAELLFASLMCERNIRTQEEFFQNINNFKNKEMIDKILTFANKDFAEFFVDRWEELLISLDHEDFYNRFLLYLAKFNSPNREKFVRSAENKALETLNEELIEKVLQCFGQTEIERFIGFYFALAQKTDDSNYYQKILDLDQGHEESQIYLFLENLRTVEDKLNFRDGKTVESTFAYLDEESRDSLIKRVVDLILPVAFYDIKKALEQLDFYLSYMAKDEVLKDTLVEIANRFSDMGFFKQAEKYLVMAISKDKENANLYWNLLKAKMHCKTDGQVVTSNVKVSQLPEWETLLSVASTQEVEKYAEILSRANLYSGERRGIAFETLDKLEILEKIDSFVRRNNAVLLEAEKEGGNLKSINYYKTQMKPFELYLGKIRAVDNFEEYVEIVGRLFERLDALDLTLDTSVRMADLVIREESLEAVTKTEELQGAEYEKTKKSIKNDVFLRRFILIFLQIIPLCFMTLVYAFVLWDSVELLKYFNVTFLIFAAIYSAIVAIINMLCLRFRKNLRKSTKVTYIILLVLAIINLVLCFIEFYIYPQIA